MQILCFIIAVACLIYMIPEENKCNVFTLENCNDFEKDKIIEYKSANIDTLKLLLEMHETEISAITYQTYSKRDTVLQRIKVIRKQILDVYDDLLSLTEMHHREMEKILEKNQKPVLEDVIKMKENTK